MSQFGIKTGSCRSIKCITSIIFCSYVNEIKKINNSFMICSYTINKKYNGINLVYDIKGTHICIRYYVDGIKYGIKYIRYSGIKKNEFSKSSYIKGLYLMCKYKTLSLSFKELNYIILKYIENGRVVY